MGAGSGFGKCLVIAGLWLCVGAAAVAQTPQRTPAAGAHLQTFRSQRQLDVLIAKWGRQIAAEEKKHPDATAMPVVMPAPSVQTSTLESVSVAGTAAVALLAPGTVASDSITNNQTQGVDEGDIVKRRGEYLIILRRGRLFTVRIGEDALRPVAQVDAYAPGSDPSGTWYDEMLVSDDTVVVIGYSYRRKATELGLFTLGADGTLAYRDTWYLRSNDYYDSRNYASRLIGSTLVFYTPLHYSSWRGEGLTYPGLARRPVGDVPASFQRLLPATAIYRADAEIDPLEDAITLHTVTRCELAGATPRCTSTGVLGPSGRTFYVSRSAVFVWLEGSGRGQSGRVLRMPLDGGPVSALRVHGMPIDQLSFLEDAGGQLNVLVQSEGRGQGMWRSEWGEGQLALLRVPLAAFGTLRARAPDGAYRFLPPIAAGDRQNRFVGDWLLYGASPYRWAPRSDDEVSPDTAYAVRYAEPDAPIRALPLGHGVERIEAMGSDAVLVGPLKSDLIFSTVALGHEQARLISRFAAGDARQSESRTHGFFYRRDDGAHGVIGLPVLRKTTPQDSASGRSETAAVLYLQNVTLDLSRLGELAAGPGRIGDDGCRASCVDWYGNARPIFIGPRVFALLGYELVEGTLAGRRISERRRVDFGPAVK